MSGCVEHTPMVTMAQGVTGNERSTDRVDSYKHIYAGDKVLWVRNNNLFLGVIASLGYG